MRNEGKGGKDTVLPRMAREGLSGKMIAEQRSEVMNEWAILVSWRRVTQAEKTAASCRHTGAQGIDRNFYGTVKFGFFPNEIKKSLESSALGNDIISLVSLKD